MKHFLENPLKLKLKGWWCGRSPGHSSGCTASYLLCHSLKINEEYCTCPHTQARGPSSEVLALLATCASASPYKSGEEEEEEEGHSGHLLPSSSTKWILGRTLHLTVTSLTLWLYCKAWNSLYATDLAFLSSTQWSASQTIKKTVEYLRELFCASEYTPNELLESCERLQICFKSLSAALCKLTKGLKLIGDKKFQIFQNFDSKSSNVSAAQVRRKTVGQIGAFYNSWRARMARWVYDGSTRWREQ